MPERIRRARPDEADALSALAFRSKAHWGYPPDFLATWRDEMRLHADAIAKHEVWVAESPGGSLIGYHRVLAGDPAELEDLWVEPHAIGSGVGRWLFQHAIEVAAGLGASALEIVSDPHAVGFYERMGAVVIGEIPSMLVAGRTLPRMRLELRFALERKYLGSGSREQVPSVYPGPPFAAHSKFRSGSDAKS